MHDDMQQPPAERVVLRHFDAPVSMRQLLHSTLDRLFDYMIEQKEPAGCVAITPLDVPEMQGGSIVLALDFVPHAHDYEGLNEGPDGL